MDIWKIKNALKTATNVVDALSDPNGPLNAANALRFIFERRFSSLPGFRSSWDYLERCSYEDFPSLARVKLIKIYSGGNALCLHLYEQPSPKGLFLCVHGIGGLSEDASSCMHDYLFRAGYDVAALDLTASGRSEGMGVKGLSQSAIDVVSALSFIHSSSLSSLPLFLLGHSWGGYGVSASLAFDSSPLAVFELAGFKDPVAIMTALPSSYVGIDLSFTEGALKEAMQSRDPDNAFLSASNAIEGARNVYCVLIQGDNDKVVVPASSLYNVNYRRNGIEKIEMKGRSHGDVMFSLSSVSYLDKAKKANDVIYKKCKKSPDRMSEGERKAYLSSFDKRLASEVDEPLFAHIVEIADALGRKRLK